MSNQIINTLWGLDVVNPAPICSVDGCEKPCQHTGNYTKTGSIVYRKTCQYHHYKKYNMSGWDYKQYRKDYCENIDGRLGFYCTATIVEPTLQLDVDHVDGNHKDNDRLNLHTLCKNCHAYKTVMFKENGHKKFRQLLEEDAHKKEVLIEYVNRKNKR
jgi:5-methylcytosine-specific restriction endonuclease McrA